MPSHIVIDVIIVVRKVFFAVDNNKKILDVRTGEIFGVAANKKAGRNQLHTRKFFLANIVSNVNWLQRDRLILFKIESSKRLKNLSLHIQ